MLGNKAKAFGADANSCNKNGMLWENSNFYYFSLKCLFLRVLSFTNNASYTPWKR